MTKVAPQQRRRRRKNTQRRAIAEIRKFQTGKFATSTLIPKSCFSRMARNLASQYNGNIRFQDKALTGLQQAAESYLVDMLKEANKICSASGRMTLQGNDLRLAISISSKEPFEAISAEAEKQAEVDAYVSEDEEVPATQQEGDDEAEDEEYTSSEQTDDEEEEEAGVNV